MPASVRRRAHPRLRHGCLSIALRQFSLARHRPGYLVFPLLTSAAPPPPPDVEVVDMVLKNVPIYGQWVVTLDGYVNAQIQPQVTSYHIKQNYKEGWFVCSRKASSGRRWAKTMGPRVGKEHLSRKVDGNDHIERRRSDLLHGLRHGIVTSLHSRLAPRC
jgi:hypothetical protein